MRQVAAALQFTTGRIAVGPVLLRCGRRALVNDGFIDILGPGFNRDQRHASRIQELRRRKVDV